MIHLVVSNYISESVLQNNALLETSKKNKQLHGIGLRGVKEFVNNKEGEIEIFEELSREIKGSTIIISHQERILKIADEIILMKSGKIEKVGTSEEILNGEILSKECCKGKKC